jgi:hypothetical protein
MRPSNINGGDIMVWPWDYVGVVALVLLWIPFVVGVKFIVGRKGTIYEHEDNAIGISVYVWMLTALPLTFLIPHWCGWI